MNKHYVCTGGCGATAEMPGLCQTDDCDKKGHSLMECKCKDGRHTEIAVARRNAGENPKAEEPVQGGQF